MQFRLKGLPKLGQAVGWGGPQEKRRKRPCVNNNLCLYSHSRFLVRRFPPFGCGAPTDRIPLQVATREGRFPDPNMDEIVAVFYAYQESSDHDDIGGVYRSGVVAVHNDRTDPKRLRDRPIETVDTELEVLNRVTDIIVEFDPDILVGWEVQTASWGYCDARGKTYGMSDVSGCPWMLMASQGYDFPELISRAPGKRQSSTTVDNWGATHTSTFKVIGRYVLNVWRVMRSEHSLEIYTFENTVFHILRKRYVSG